MSEYTLYSLQPVLRIQSLCTAFVAERGADFSYEGESHNFYEVVFVLMGEAGITAGDEILCLHPGQMLVHPPMEFHRIWNNSDENLKFLVFSFDAQSFPEMQKHRTFLFTAKQGTQMKEAIEDLRANFVKDGHRLLAPIDDEALTKIQQVVNHIEDLLLSLLQRGQPVDMENTKSARRYTETVLLMQRNLHRRFDVDELAQMVNMSRSALQKMFYRYAGMGVIKFYTHLQVLRAQEMLEQGTSVKETALALGFEDQNYFSRLFRRFTNRPPSAFRPKKEK